MVKCVTPKWLITENQMVNNFNIMKIDKNCNFLTEMRREHTHPYTPPTEGILRERLQRLPHSGARSNSAKRDPQGHAQYWNRFFTLFRMTKIFAVFARAALPRLPDTPSGGGHFEIRHSLFSIQYSKKYSPLPLRQAQGDKKLCGLCALARTALPRLPDTIFQKIPTPAPPLEGILTPYPLPLLYFIFHSQFSTLNCPF